MKEDNGCGGCLTLIIWIVVLGLCAGVLIR